ncbi:MAG: PadR family transcriptional regulator [Erysipelothrix sp.]
MSEPMFYVLLSLLEKARCGSEIANYVQELTNDRISLPPGTLYGITGKFLKGGMIKELPSDNNQRYYSITREGRNALKDEISRLQMQLRDTQTVYQTL